MCNQIIGEIDCPICGSKEATLHRHAKGRNKKMYIRCYKGVGGSVMQCGTLQALGPVAQEYMLKHGRFYEGLKPQTEAPKPAPETKKDAIASQAQNHEQKDAIAASVQPEVEEIQKKNPFLKMLIG